MNAVDILRMLEEPTEDRRPLVHELETEAPTDALIGALRLATMPLTRNILCDILGSRRAADAVHDLLLAMQDASPAVRAAAADALAKIGDPASGMAIFMQMTAEVDASVRQMLVLALGSVGYKDASSHLVQLLGDADETTRGCAAWSLGELNPKGAKAALEQALQKERGVYARQRIEEALSKLGRA